MSNDLFGGIAETVMPKDTPQSQLMAVQSKVTGACVGRQDI